MAGEPILIIDDNPQDLKLARVLLIAEGFTVRTAVDAEDALTILKSFAPKLILTDIQMPGMDGLTLIRQLRTDLTHRDTVIVALTASAMKGDEEKAYDAGCDGYITKPVDTASLGRQLLAHLERQPVRRK